MFGIVWDYYSSKRKGKQYKQNTSPRIYKIEIKDYTSLACPRLSPVSVGMTEKAGGRSR